MKKSTFFFCILFSCPFFLKAQEINWRNLNMTNKHVISLQIGANFGTVYGISYGYQLPFKHPVTIGAGISVPFGKNFMDDYKVDVNAQTEIWHSNSFSFAVKPAMSMRRYHSEAASLYNVGAEITTTIGYFKNNWGVAVEANYDRSCATYIEHVKLKEYYPGIRDGWYDSTGGNFKFGVKGNYWMKSTGLSLKAGRIYGQNFSDNPTLPFYGEFSILHKFQ
jgi:hypothetical protein